MHEIIIRVVGHAKLKVEVPPGTDPKNIEVNISDVVAALVVEEAEVVSASELP